MRRILALVAAASLAGCSLFIQGPSSSTPPDQFPRCAEDSLLPAVDVAWAVLYALSGTLVAIQSPPEDDAKVGGILSATIGTAVFGAAAWHGFNKVKRCGQVRDAYRARYEEVQRELAAPPAPSMQLGPPSSLPGGPPETPAAPAPPPPPAP